MHGNKKNRNDHNKTVPKIGNIDIYINTEIVLLLDTYYIRICITRLTVIREYLSDTWMRAFLCAAHTNHRAIRFAYRLF